MKDFLGKKVKGRTKRSRHSMGRSSRFVVAFLCMLAIALTGNPRKSEAKSGSAAAGATSPAGASGTTRTEAAPGRSAGRLVRESLRISLYDFPVTENLDLAAAALGRRTLQPGQSFSLNEALGPRTASKGYRPARAFAGSGNVIEEVGGGLCMVSTALYQVFARAGLDVTERFAHMKVVSYALPGFDAAINYRSKDLRVTNSLSVPVTFRIYRHGKVLTAELLAQLDPELEVRLTRHVSSAVIPGRVQNGFYVRTVRTFLRQGLPVRAEVLSSDVFAPIDHIQEHNDDPEP